MTFAANDIAWSDNKPSDVMATVVVTTAHPDNREFTFPMEFVSFKGGWQLSRQTAEMLLAMGNSPDSTPSATSPAPAPSPTPWLSSRCGLAGWNSTCCWATCAHSSRSGR